MSSANLFQDELLSLENMRITGPEKLQFYGPKKSNTTCLNGLYSTSNPQNGRLAMHNTYITVLLNKR